MIQKEFYKTREDGIDLYQRKSDKDVKLLQVETGRMYDDPVDIEPCPYTYEETDIPIDSQPEELTVEDTLTMLNELGVDTDDQ